jgi:class 3 adenylate cyclase/tetratricopeptide (TPR) repeat protein
MSEEGGTCGRCGAAAPAGQRFCGQCGSPLAGPPEERRWVTVVFADLVGFTTRSEDMDPEDVRTFVDEVMVRLVPIIERHGGWVNRIIGDAVLAVFGAPVAHEDDPERAVRAALAMTDEVARRGLEPGSISLRVGVNSGDAMLGTVGSELTVMGDAVNTAARLQTSARPGQVLVGEATVSACGPALHFQIVDELTVKGKRQPVTAYEPVGPSPVPGRRRLLDTPLVGRSTDFASLVGCWRAVVADASPRLVVLLGEAGMGKSRLAGELAGVVEQDGGRVLRGGCLPYGEVLGYRALAEALDAWAGIDLSDDVAAARTKLAALAEGLGLGDTDAAEHLALLAGVSGKSGNGQDQASLPQARLHASVRAVLERASQERPTCLVVDDVHWADAALLDLLESVAAKSTDARLLVVAAARPELIEGRPGWGETGGSTTAVRLEPLDALSGARLATALCSRYGLSVQRSEDIERAAGGNPLFAEEVAAVLVGQPDASGPVPLPGSLKASIAARLDALPADERGVLQLASVVGLTFWRTALLALRAEPEPGPLLARLERRGLARRLDRSELAREDEWAFKHGLIREVAYEMLPRARRKVLHGALVDWMMARAGDRIEGYLDLLAHHAVAAERFEAALGYLDGAAERARRAAAHRAEADLLGEALEMAARVGHDDVAAGLHARRGRALARVGAWAAAREELESALGALEDGEARAEVEVDLSEVCFWLFDIEAQRAHGVAGRELAEAAGRADLAAGAMASLAQAEQADGELAAEKSSYRAAIERAGGFTIGPLAGAPLAFYLAGDIGEALALAEQVAAAVDQVHDIAFTMWALSYLGLSLAANGRYSEAGTVFDRARRYGDEYGVGPLTARAVAMASGYRYDVGDTEGAVSLAEEAQQRARSVGFAPTVLSAGIDVLLARARSGEPGEVKAIIDEVGQGIETTKHWHEWLWRMRFAQARAELALAGGDPAAAVPFATDAMARARRHGRRKYEADSLAALGRAHLAMGGAAEALACLRPALAVAESVGDPALTLRAGSLLAADAGDESAALAAASATDRIRAGLPAGLRPHFDAYRDRLLAAGH